MRPFTGYVRRTTIALAFAVAGTAVHPQSWQPPADSQRCPSKWGAGDQRGSGNHMKPETVLRAVKLIRTGEVIELGHEHLFTFLRPFSPRDVSGDCRCAYDLAFGILDWRDRQ